MAGIDVESQRAYLVFAVLAAKAFVVAIVLVNRFSRRCRIHKEGNRPLIPVDILPDLSEVKVAVPRAFPAK